MTKTNLLVSADITVWLHTGLEKKLRVENIPCTWVWKDGPRAAAEYWAVSNWVVDAFKDDLENYSIVCVAGSPVA